MTMVLTGLDIEAKAVLAETMLFDLSAAVSSSTRST